MQIDQDLGVDEEVPDGVRASDQGGGTLGFAGAATKSGVNQPAGLATPTRGGLGDGPTVPMMPSGWGDND